VKPFSGLLCLLFSSVTFVAAQSGIIADPDLLASGLSWNGATAMKIGDEVQFKRITLGGFIETRNEARFNQGVFPNHNWRGYATLRVDIIHKSAADKDASLAAGFLHESGHATMGIAEPTHNPYEMIYDNSDYRTMSMNAGFVRYTKQMRIGRFSPGFMIDYRLYIGSKNTPELAGRAFTEGSGIAGGIEAGYALKGDAKLFLSLWDRGIFEGRTRTTGKQYSLSDTGTLVTESVSRSPIAAINTGVIRAGISLKLPKLGRNVALSGGWQTGNISGYVDSRDDRSLWSLSVLLIQ